jgi:hypothetical protein
MSVHEFGGKMIVFAVVFGAPHIEMFFERCLPSLMTPGNLPSLGDEKLNLLIGTLDQDEALIHRKFRENPSIEAVFSNIEVMPSAAHESISAKVGHDRLITQSVVYHLLMRCVTACFRSQQPFLFAVADLMYLDGTVRSSWDLFKATGRTVAILSVKTRAGDRDTAYYRRLFDIPGGIKAELFENLTFAQYRSVSDMNPSVANAPTMDGTYGVVSGDHLMIFSRNPSPILGQFQSDDLLFLGEHERINMWDNHWVRFLNDSGRLLVQTNMDLGVTIEPEPSEELGSKLDRNAARRAQTDEKRGRLFSDLLETSDFKDAARRRRFDNPMNNYCFSIRVDGIRR